MIPAPFEYQRVDSVDEAIQALSGEPDAKILAGGHSLLPLMRVRLSRPSKLMPWADPDAVRSMPPPPVGRTCRHERSIERTATSSFASESSEK